MESFTEAHKSLCGKMFWHLCGVQAGPETSQKTVAEKLHKDLKDFGWRKMELCFLQIWEVLHEA